MATPASQTGPAPAHVEHEPREVDYFRDSALRYLGYTNEVGEAFRPLVHPRYVTATYGVAFNYVLADAFFQSAKKSNADQHSGLVFVDSLLWQSLASVAIPGVTINLITKASSKMMVAATQNKTVRKFAPTVIGLSAIPLIIKPIDEFTDVLMDSTFRAMFKK